MTGLAATPLMSGMGDGLAKKQVGAKRPRTQMPMGGSQADNSGVHVGFYFLLLRSFLYDITSCCTICEENMFFPTISIN